MRKSSRTLVLSLATAAISYQWTPLPSVPRGLAIGVSGDGQVVASNAIGGSSLLVPPSAPATGPGRWTPLLAIPDARVVKSRGKLAAVLGPDGIFTKNLESSSLSRAWFPQTSSPVDFDLDGHRVLASVARTSELRQLFISVDSQIPHPKGAYGMEPDRWDAWRPLGIPDTGLPNPVYWRGLTGWIEGRLVLASDGGNGWISRDTGRTWSHAPGFVDADIQGDTIVGRCKRSERLWVSRDAGTSWDTTATVSGPGPGEIQFRGGRLYAFFSKADTTWELATSSNLGLSWNTLLGGLGIRHEVAWDGTSLWTIAKTEIVRSSNGGSSWNAADTNLSESRMLKIRCFGNRLVALQDKQDLILGYGTSPWKRLWSYKDGQWRILRDSVCDFEVMETDTGTALFALVGGGTWHTEYPHPVLERSYLGTDWQRISSVVPIVPVLGVSTRGLIVGESTRAAIIGTDGTVRRDSTWGTSISPVDMIRFLVEQDGRILWGWQGGVYGLQNMLTPEAVIPSTLKVRGMAMASSSYGFMWGDSTNNRTIKLVPEASSPFYSPVRAEGAILVRDSFAVWAGSDYLLMIDADAQSMDATRYRGFNGPGGAGVADLGWVPRRLVDGSAPKSGDSVFVAADLHGGLHWLAPEGTSAISMRTSSKAGSRITVLGQEIRIDLNQSGMVRLERFDLHGRNLGPLVESRLEPGVHTARIPVGGGPSLLVLRIDGIRQGEARILP